MHQTFKPIACGQTLPLNNVHAVSVSMPKLQDVIDYEEDPLNCEKIQSGYPRFVMHPYLKKLARHLEEKYKIDDSYEVVLLSSQKAVKIVSDFYFIHNPCEIKEPFGVILVKKQTSQLQKVLTFIQHVGANLSSRLAEDYLFDLGLIESKHQEKRVEKDSKTVLLEALAKAYKQPKQNIAVAPSGMNAIYSVVNGLKGIQAHNGRTILVQFGWLYLDTMNIVNTHYDESKTFLNIYDLDALEHYLKENGLKTCAIITEVPTNPLIQCVDLVRLKNLCTQYNIPLIIDVTLATPYNVEFKNYADIMVESLTKYACGNADVLMGCVVFNEKSKLSHMKKEFFKHIDEPYINDIKRMAYQIGFYEQRMQTINHNCYELIQHLEKQPYIKRVYHALQEGSKENYLQIMRHDKAVGGLISLEFSIDFQKAYDRLNFAKGPSLGTEFTLLMPYVYLAHYDYITSKEGQEILKKHQLPINLLRVAVGIEDIQAIKEEFDRLKQFCTNKE